MQRQIIGLIAAMPQEIAPLLKRIRVQERLHFGRFNGYRLMADNLDCLLVETGIGAWRAEAAAQALVEAVRPDLILSFGIAGAVEDDLRIGDVVAGSRVCFLKDGMLGTPIALASLPPEAQQAAAHVLQARSASLVSGTIVTTPGSQTISRRPPEFTHPVLEMETGAVARVASARHIPLLALRAISDTPAEPIPFPIEEIYDEEYRLRTGRMIGDILRRPGLLPRLLRVERNARRAEENAAVAVSTILAEPWNDLLR
jgi:adenosylhomocysteine nucleosidase